MDERTMIKVHCLTCGERGTVFCTSQPALIKHVCGKTPRALEEARDGQAVQG